MDKHYRRAFILVSSTLLLYGCAGSNPAVESSYYAAPSANKVPDYGNLYYWAAHPFKKDPSDSTPAIYSGFVPDSSVDVFFIYPTTYTTDTIVNSSLLDTDTEKKRWNANVNDAALNAKTDYSTILKQASAFNKYRVFSPRYRQAHIKSFFIADSLSEPFFSTAYTDVKTAFQYYLDHYNQGRPFIIASHSQGTVHAAHLIKEMIENTPLEQKMIAAYLIGMPIRVNYFASCVPCATSSQTDCFVSWRTFKKGYIPASVANEKLKVFVINPLTWTMDTLPAPKSLNKGAILFKFNKPTKGVSAQIKGNILWASKPHFFGSIFFKRKNYHIGDINLFWKNIRDNVDERVASYKAKSVGRSK